MPADLLRDHHDAAETFCLASDESPRSEPPEAASDTLTVGEIIGEGGVAKVHTATQPRLEREVAVKLLKRGSTAKAQARLLREAQVMGSLQHPNIIPVHAIGTDERGTPLLIMKRVRGATWAELFEDPDAAGSPHGEGLESGERSLATATLDARAERGFEE